jgi:hypothetical protein
MCRRPGRQQLHPEAVLGLDNLTRNPAMTYRDPAARTALEDVAVIDRGPAVSWGAIFAGALSAAALSFVLLAIGAAFGLSVISPWDIGRQSAGEAAAAAGIGAAIFLIIVHALSSGIGGYLAGRLRSKLVGVRGDETYFRDTAHGLVVWAVSAVATVFLLACLAAGVARGGVALGAAGLNAAGQAVGGAMAAAGPDMMDRMRGDRDTIGYFLDTLFRPATSGAANGGGTTNQPASDQTGNAQPAAPRTAPSAASPATVPMSPGQAGGERRGQRDEVGRILRHAMAGELSPEDKTYAAQLVAQQTGISQQEAEQRIDQLIDKAKGARAEAEQKAKEAADAARKAGMYTALWSAVAMLAGAFCAALAATWGGRARDL